MRAREHPLVSHRLPSVRQRARRRTETIGLGTTLAIGAFLAIAVLVVASIVCKLLIVAGLVPERRNSPLGRAIVWLASVVGQLRLGEGLPISVAVGDSREVVADHPAGPERLESSELRRHLFLGGAQSPAVADWRRPPVRARNSIESLLAPRKRRSRLPPERHGQPKAVVASTGFGPVFQPWPRPDHAA